jgi:hypothetical protein
MDLEENISVQTGKFRILAVIFIGIFIFGVGGIGGYWVGSKRQQSSLTELPTSKSSWLPSAPPAQSLSLTPSIAISQTTPTTNWKIYANTDLGFSIDYPSNMYLYREGWEDTKLPRQLWSIGWANLKNERVKNAYDPNTTGIKREDLYHLGYYSFSVSVDNEAMYQAPYSTTKEPITEENLILLLGEPQKFSYTSFQGRLAVRDESTAIYGYLNTDVGGSVNYYILDGQRVIRLEGTTSNLNKVPISAIDQILSTFKFLE